MDFLKNKNFTPEEINNLNIKYEDYLDTIELISDNIEEVIDYLEEYGVKDIYQLINNRLDIFYLPVSKMREIFSHYDKKYILEVLDEDPFLFDSLV